MTQQEAFESAEPLGPLRRPEVNVPAIEALLAEAMRPEPISATDVTIEPSFGKKYFIVTVTSEEVKDSMLSVSSIRKEMVTRWQHALMDGLFPNPDANNDRNRAIAGSGLKIKAPSSPTHKGTLALRFEFPNLQKKETFMAIFAEMGKDKIPPVAETRRTLPARSA